MFESYSTTVHEYNHAEDGLIMTKIKYCMTMYVIRNT